MNEYTHILLTEKEARNCGLASPMTCNEDGLSEEQSGSIRGAEYRLVQSGHYIRSAGLRASFPETFAPEPVATWERTGEYKVPEHEEWFESRTLNGEPMICPKIDGVIGPRWILRKVTP